MRRQHYLLFALCILLGGQLWAQQKTVSGTVTASEDGTPLPGVTILKKGTTTGTQTDFDGNYQLDVLDSDQLVFSYVGFQSQEIAVGNQTVIDIALVADVSELDEVVVVGYGSQVKRRITDNIASISSEQINEIPTPSLQSTLTAKAAGVQVTQLNGKVEGGVKIRVRGVSTISASQEPLYVVDGVPVINADESINTSPINPLITLNPNDIESIEILKDASSAAIYGARGTNGLVIITTKRGKEGKTTVSVNSSYGWSEATNFREWMNAEEYFEFFSEAALNSGFDLATTDFFFSLFSFTGTTDPFELGTIDTDWQELALVKGSVRDLGFSVSGGGQKTQFFFSGAHNETEGIVRGNILNRYTIRSNINHSVSDKFQVGVNATLSKTIIDRLSNDNAFATPMQAIAQPPIVRAFNNDGSANRDTFYYNFLVEDQNGNFQTNIWRALANVYAQYQILPSLNFRTEFGYDYNDQVAERFSGSLTESQSVGGFGTANAVQTERFIATNYFTFTQNFEDDINLEATAGMSFEETRRKNQFLQGQGFPSDDLQTLNSAAEIVAGGSSRTAFNFLSYFGRATVSLYNKVFLKGSLRYDGSSRFGDNNEFGWFPAASAGYLVSEEDFIKESNFLSLLKLRASWGITGNAGIGNFASLSLFGGSPYNQRAGLAPTQLGNPALKWERTTQIDVGLDFGFFNNRITGELDYYVKKTEDLLLNEPIPGTGGFNTITRNIGELENRGLEFVLNTKNILTEDFDWRTNINLSFNDNEVTKLPGGDIIAGQNIVREGETISSFFMVEYAGVDPANGDALFYTNTLNADGSRDRSTTNNFNEAERVILGAPFPDLIGGITNTFRYKDVDLSFTFQGEWGASLYNNAGRFQSSSGNFFDNQSRDQLRRWQQPGDITDVPQARLGGSNGNQNSSRYLQESDFIRLRNVSLGYTLPRKFTENMFIDRLRIGFTGFNLLTFTDFDGYDPESTADFNGNNNIVNGITFYSAPPAKTYTFTLNIDF